MPGRHQPGLRHRPGLRWVAAALSLGTAGAAAGIAILAAAPAGAAPISPSYHAGSDTATFSATGVRDSNCLVSTGGTEVWIKPGDKINFKSDLAGINLGPLSLGTDKVIGMNVRAAIDSTPTSPGLPASVSAGHTTVFPKTGQKALSTGDHRLAWTATSVSVQPVLALGVLGPVVKVPLSSPELKSGASLSWAGVIHVTNDAVQCKLSVGTPTIGVSVGPIHVTVPPISVGVPVPTVPALPGGGTTTAPGGGKKTTPDQFNYTPPALTVPEAAMGGMGAGSGGGFDGVQPDANGATQLGSGLPQGAGPKPDSSTGGTGSAAAPQTSTKRIDLASNKPQTAQVPVLLAIIAGIALALVSATYARLLLLRRNT